ncbi:hypothetical protein A2483_05175 [Candidatus Peregrinibacteria bacterium RIFOXYC2_FULL_33_13]|nr:MAG: hypothetical protein UR27_C0011G0007 [Candidatus Peregrinibacteria bacterium GW2011_GWA2_33_10]KKP38869.1 MAG: hypothetical protein UR30_C0014G0007 [Candidatus Peregrinibacteria bacterium GW2011_GWC2_33_13]OGJ54472.1 MAG: hypothetical protein A2483_05175 [Candidatus Peregrinibacteria bacterium RIFOXYC2_FULL_33_13]
MTKPELPFKDEDELQRALTLGENPESSTDLRYKNLEIACDDIFKKSPTLDNKTYKNAILEKKYTINLEKYGEIHLIKDIYEIVDCLHSAISGIQQQAPGSKRSQACLIIGCGPGREVIPTIETANILNRTSSHGKAIGEIVINDLSNKNIDYVREMIAEIYNTREENIHDINLKFKPGDFNTIKFANKKDMFDIIEAFWYVSCEICDFSSKQAMKELQKHFYTKIKMLLTQKGRFIEDYPYANEAPSYYYTLLAKSYHILREKNLLPDLRDQVILNAASEYEKETPTNYPYHIRHLAFNGIHREQMEKYGLYEQKSDITLYPEKIISDCQKEYRQLFGSYNHDKSNPDYVGKKIIEFFKNYEKIPSLLRQLEMIINQIYVYPEEHDRKFKKTYIWGKDKR